MNKVPLFVLPFLVLLTASCRRAPAPATPEIGDPPRLERVRRVDLAERAPAYGVAIGRGDALRLEVSVEAGDSTHVQPGQTAEVTVIPSTAVISCRVERVLISASAETGQSLAWLKPLVPSGRLAPNDFVYARITTRVRRGVLTAPLSAVMVSAGRSIVVRSEDGGNKLTPVPVVIGAHDAELVEIVSGLSAGDEVIVEGGLGPAFPDFKAGDN